MPSEIEKTRVAELLTIITGDPEFKQHKQKITDNFIVEAEKTIASQRSCINNSGRFTALLNCIPTTPNAVGWIVKCNSSVFDQVIREHRGKLHSNMICSGAMMKTHVNHLKTVLMLGF